MAITGEPGIKHRRQTGVNTSEVWSGRFNTTLEGSQKTGRKTVGNNPVRITDGTVRGFKGNFEVLSESPAAKLWKQSPCITDGTVRSFHREL